MIHRRPIKIMVYSIVFASMLIFYACRAPNEAKDIETILRRLFRTNDLLGAKVDQANIHRRGPMGGTTYAHAQVTLPAEDFQDLLKGVKAEKLNNDNYEGIFSIHLPEPYNQQPNGVDVMYLDTTYRIYNTLIRKDGGYSEDGAVSIIKVDDRNPEEYVIFLNIDGQLIYSDSK